jgi:hypothetical protein
MFYNADNNLKINENTEQAVKRSPINSILIKSVSINTVSIENEDKGNQINLK